MKSKEKTTDIHEVLGIKNRNSRRKRRGILSALLIIGIAGGWLGWNRLRQSSMERTVQYRTETASKGDLTVRVTATGQLKPTNTVEVGSEVSGTIDTVEVDYNSKVKVGQVLAKINLDKLQAALLQTKASLESARAGLQDAQVTLSEKKHEYDRILDACEGSDSRLFSQSDVDAAEANFERAKVAVINRQAAVTQAEATLALDETNIKKAVIKSPVNGIVLSRAVEPGQTIAASFSTPTMFTLAEDLTKMKLEVNIDEADVGQVEEEQPVTFTVDAYPGRNFPGKILQVRYQSTTTNNVVTYTAIISVDNKDLLLRPGMTATASIAVKSVKNALLVPNIALRYSPLTAAEEKKTEERGLMSLVMPGPPPTSSGKTELRDESDKGTRVWVLRNRMPFPVEVSTGITDGKMTQILSGLIEDGTYLIVDTLKEGT